MSAPGAPSARSALSPRRVRWLLAALVIWSFLLRLGFAAYDLHRGRFYDERYSLENLQHLLAPGPEARDPQDARDRSVWQRLRPANGWYPSLSYLPQVPLLAASQGLHRLTGNPRLAVFEPGAPEPTPTPTAYFLCRASVAAFGALTLVLTFRVARRLFGPERGPAIGLVAVVLLAASPAHLRQSAMFKPDMLLTLCTLGVFLACLSMLEATRRVPWRAWRRWVFVGIAVGLATASKLNGVFTAMLPVLTAGLLVWIPRRSRGLEAGDADPEVPRETGPETGRETEPETDRQATRRLGPSLLGLVLAGAVSAAVYLALNPFVGLQAEYLDRNLEIYQERAELAGLDRLTALGEAASHLVSAGFHGRAVLGWIALVGLLGLAARWRTAKQSTGPELAWVLVPAWVVSYGLLYTGTAAYPKPNNLLPLLPFLSLAAAWGLVVSAREAWCLLVRGRPGWVGEEGSAKARRTATVWGTALVAAGIVVLWVPLHVYAYRTAVPSTRDLLERELTAALQPFAGRTVLFAGPLPEGMALPELLTRRDAVAVRRLAEVPVPEQVALADAVVSLAGEAPELEGGGGDLRRIGPELGRSWGPTWELRLHSWELKERQRHWAEQGVERWVLPMPDLSEPPGLPGSESEGPWLSVQVLIRDPEPPPTPPRLEAAGREIPLHATRVETGGYVYGTAFTSVRFGAEGEGVVVVFPGGAEWEKVPVVDVLVWGGGSGFDSTSSAAPVGAPDLPNALVSRGFRPRLSPDAPSALALIGGPTPVRESPQSGDESPVSSRRPWWASSVEARQRPRISPETRSNPPTDFSEAARPVRTSERSSPERRRPFGAPNGLPRDDRAQFSGFLGMYEGDRREFLGFPAPIRVTCAVFSISGGLRV